MSGCNWDAEGLWVEERAEMIQVIIDSGRYVDPVISNITGRVSARPILAWKPEGYKQYKNGRVRIGCFASLWRIWFS